MKRVNYLPSWSERRIGVALPSLITAELRGPIVAFAGSLALAGALWGAQAARLTAAEGAGAAFAVQLASMQADVARIRVIEQDVARMQALDERVAAIRGSGAVRANEIAALGNRLPPDIWLSSLRADRGALALDGRASALAAVGTTIASLAASSAYRAARLVAIHQEPARAGVTYAITLEPAQ